MVNSVSALYLHPKLCHKLECLLTASFIHGLIFLLKELFPVWPEKNKDCKFKVPSLITPYFAFAVRLSPAKGELWTAEVRQRVLHPPFNQPWGFCSSQFAWAKPSGCGLMEESSQRLNYFLMCPLVFLTPPRGSQPSPGTSTARAVNCQYCLVWCSFIQGCNICPFFPHFGKRRGSESGLWWRNSVPWGCRSSGEQCSLCLRLGNTELIPTL